MQFVHFPNKVPDDFSLRHASCQLAPLRHDKSANRYDLSPDSKPPDVESLRFSEYHLVPRRRSQHVDSGLFPAYSPEPSE